jgi:hypothetical protein
MIEPKGLTPENADLLEDTIWLADQGISFPRENVKALAQVTYAYINALGEANAELERYRTEISEALVLLNAAYMEGVGEESAPYLEEMEAVLRGLLVD